MRTSGAHDGPPVITGSPLLMPGSPDALAACGLTSAVPEPGAAAMFLAGLLVVGTAARKRVG